MPGEEGTWVFIFGDLTVFSILFGVFLYYRGQESAVFTSSQRSLNEAFGLANTLILLTSSLFVVTAVRAVRRGANALAGRLLIGAMVCGLGFIVNKGFEYGQKVSHDLVPTTNEFFMYYYVMTGLHLLHVIIGMLLLALAFVLSKRPSLSDRQHGYLDGAACFWHMVDLLWIVLFALLYLVHQS
jgi:nitric oxide reductase NorE protein